MTRTKVFLFSAFCAFCLYSCVPANKLYYFHDLKPGVQQIDSSQQNAVIKINKGDRITIVVSSSDPTLTAFLNPFTNQNLGSLNQQFVGYLVNQEGMINFPLLGQLQADGYTTDELTNIIRKKLEYYYKEPYVYVNIAGKVYFINGRNGTTIPLTNERLTILEAIAQSGVQDAYDKKSEVWLIREENGKRTFAQLNLNNKAIFDSPYYYLHNNDVLYLQPGKYSFLASNSPARTALTFGGILFSLFFALRKI